MFHLKKDAWGHVLFFIVQIFLFLPDSLDFIDLVIWNAVYPNNVREWLRVIRITSPSNFKPWFFRTHWILIAWRIVEKEVSIIVDCRVVLLEYLHLGQFDLFCHLRIFCSSSSSTLSLYLTILCHFFLFKRFFSQSCEKCTLTMCWGVSSSSEFSQHVKSEESFKLWRCFLNLQCPFHYIVNLVGYLRSWTPLCTNCSSALPESLNGFIGNTFNMRLTG